MAAKLARLSWVPGGLATVIVITLGRLASSVTSVAPLESIVYDRTMRAAQLGPSADIAIVAIDETSMEKLGEWPWPRDVHASMLNRLRALGVRVVAFTAPLGSSRRTSEPERMRAALALLESSDLSDSDQARQLRRMLGSSARGSDPNSHLAQAIAAHANVVLPIGLQIGEAPVKPVELPDKFLPLADSSVLTRAATAGISHRPPGILIDAASAVGHTYLQTDADGKVRSDLAVVRVGSVLVPSLATAIAARAAGVAPGELAFHSGNTLLMAGRAIPVDSALRTRPHYFASEAAPFEQYGYWEVLAGEIPATQLRGKIAVIGFVDAGSRAPVATPVSGASSAPEVIASAVSSLLDRTTYSRPGYAVALEWIAALGVIVFAAFALPTAGAGIGALATVLVVAILAVSEIGLLSSIHVWARLMLPCVAMLVAYGVYLAGELMRRANRHAATTRDAPGNRHSQGQRREEQRQPDLTARDPNSGDPHALRVRVRQEPASHKPVHRPLTRSVPDADTPGMERDEPAPATPARPAWMLGRYEIERELGRGAMGVVYLGRDPKINRVVAIKAIALADEFDERELEEARARFFREAEMAGRLTHPAIVTVYDAGEDRGLAYIAMEYLRGRHLSHFTDASRLLPPKSVILLVARVAEALHYAHRQNVVHRDIKPANIMFNSDTDELKITDFGIARLTDTSRTKTGIVLGTPSFMSPEQLEGRTLDGRSDQFALGVSLYQLLCGQLPFRAESMPRLMQKIATEPHASVRALRPELPPCIDPIIERVLAKSADHRYATCAELAAALRACAGHGKAGRAAEPQHEWLIP